MDTIFSLKNKKVTNQDIRNLFEMGYPIYWISFFTGVFQKDCVQALT